MSTERREDYRHAELVEDLPPPSYNTMAGEAMALADANPGQWVRTGHKTGTSVKIMRDRFPTYEWETRQGRLYVRSIAHMPKAER